MTRKSLTRFFLAGFLLTVAACSPYSADKRHFLASQQAFNEAIRIVNTAGDARRPILAEEGDRITSLLETALAQARLVSDDFLGKFNKDHAFYYRNRYQVGLETWIRGMKDVDLLAALEGQRLTNEYREWFARIRRSR